MADEPYFQSSNSGPSCSTVRSAALRQRRFEMGRVKLDVPAEYERLGKEVTAVFRASESADPSMARAKALRHVVANCPVEIEPGTVLVGGENPFFFNVMYESLIGDRYARDHAPKAADEAGENLRKADAFMGPCFEGHITPGLEYVLGQGIQGLRWRVQEHLQIARGANPQDLAKVRWYESLLESCQSVLLYADRYRRRALELAALEQDPARRQELTQAADVLSRVPENPAQTFHEALQSFWLVYTLVTVEMGGCVVGGGLGLGRLDQFLYPYYKRDLEQGRLTRAAALELMELFLLGFRHVDYHTWHQIYTPGSQTSLGGVTPNGLDASNELTELILEASLRIAMPAPYVSLRLHRDAPARYWQAAANYVLGGLGFSIVNDEVLIGAMLRHGRSLGDARDYICSCCYENTVPGREAFHPSGVFLNLPLVLELALNEGRSLLTGRQLGDAVEPARTLASLDAVLSAFGRQLHAVCDRMVATINQADEAHCAHRRYPLMSLFIEDCIARGKDVCAGGARYNLTGCIVAGLPNVVNSLAAIRGRVFGDRSVAMGELADALAANFEGRPELQRQLLTAPKWGNDEPSVDDLAATVTQMIYDELSPRTNARGGRWQGALYSFIANHRLGRAVGASADGRSAGQTLTRNLDPAWGTDRKGPTAVLKSLSHIDFTQFPNGCSLDLVFDPRPFQDPRGREAFVAFLKGFVNLQVMQMQISLAGAETLLDARKHPERWPNLMVKVAGYSARFVDLPEEEKDELIARTTQRLA